MIVVASGGMYTEQLDVAALDPEPATYDGTKAYARCKRAQVVLAEEWTRHLLGAGIAVNAMHPGWADTPGLWAALPGFSRIVGPLLRTPEEGVDTIAWLAAAPDAADPRAACSSSTGDRGRRTGCAARVVPTRPARRRGSPATLRQACWPRSPADRPPDRAAASVRARRAAGSLLVIGIGRGVRIRNRSQGGVSASRLYASAARLDREHAAGARAFELEDIARDDRRVAVRGDGLRPAGETANALPRSSSTRESRPPT